MNSFVILFWKNLILSLSKLNWINRKMTMQKRNLCLRAKFDGCFCFPKVKPGGDCVRVSGTVWHVINDNFALAEVENNLALFDTYDFYVSKTGTAADAGKSLKEVVTAGQVRIHPTHALFW